MSIVGTRVEGLGDVFIMAILLTTRKTTGFLCCHGITISPPWSIHYALVYFARACLQLKFCDALYQQSKLTILERRHRHLSSVFNL